MHTPLLPDPTPQNNLTQHTSSPGLRVSFITHHAELYGANLSLLNLIEGLAPYGVRSHVISPEAGEFVPELARRGIPTAVLPFEWWVSPRRAVPGAAARLLRNIRYLRPIATQIAHWESDL